MGLKWRCFAALDTQARWNALLRDVKKRPLSVTLAVACCQARLLSRSFICRLGKNWWRRSIRLLWYMNPMWFPGRLSHNVCYCAGGKKAVEYGALWCHPSAATGTQGVLVPSRLNSFICPFTGSVTYLIKCSLETRLQTEFHPQTWALENEANCFFCMQLPPAGA